MTAEPADRFYEFPGAAVALCRLGQRSRAAVDPGPWRARPLPQLGCDRARTAAAFPCRGPGSARAWRFRMGEGEQLQPGRSCLRSHPADPLHGLQDAAIVGHSMGGMVSLAYAGTYPAQVSRLGVLDGVFLAGSRRTPIHEQMSRWIDQLDRIGEREPSAFRTIEEASQRLSTRNKRLTPHWRCISPATASGRTPTACIAGSSIIICGRGRRIGCCRTTISACGRGLPARPC